MTASNPCCLKCNGYRSEKYPKRPECNDQYCPCHRPLHVSSGGSREKSGCGLNHCDHTKCVDIPAAKFCECKFPLIDHSRNVDVCQVCCLFVVDADWQNKEGFIEKKIVPPQPAAVEKAKPYFSFFPKLKPLTDAEKKEMIAGISFEPEKDIEENLRLMNHGIIYQQPEKEWWEDELPEAILAALEYRGFYDAGKYLNDTFLEHIRPIISRIAAQSEKKGRETQEKYQELILAVGSIHPNETRHETALRYIQQAEEGSSVAARSSEEGKTGL